MSSTSKKCEPQGQPDSAAAGSGWLPPAVLGQARLQQQLRAWAQSGSQKVLLLTGPRGSGRKSVLTELAWRLLCQGGQAGATQTVPCGSCRACRYLKEGVHPDFRLLAPQAEEKILPVDRVRREFVNDLFLRPQLGRYKVYILEADYLSEGAQNAILKSLEEAPPYACIFLTAARPDQVLPTILSRLEVYRTAPYEDTTLYDILRLHGVETEHRQTRLAVLLAAGNPGEALRLSGCDWLDEVMDTGAWLWQQLQQPGHAALLTDGYNKVAALRDAAAGQVPERLHALLTLYTLRLQISLDDLYKQRSGPAAAAAARGQTAAVGWLRDLLPAADLPLTAIELALEALRSFNQALSSNGNFEIGCCRTLLQLQQALSVTGPGPGDSGAALAVPYR
ncbi:MAG: hypothetical protein PHR21_07305 [Oscillospiraceae bacterium]|nr:hypothetical protein [Oscillospiraceae bacterium]MDD4368305.1 hypothetical protein [Oscillospiraceae bacterium]